MDQQTFPDILADLGRAIEALNDQLNRLRTNTKHATARELLTASGYTDIVLYDADLARKALRDRLSRRVRQHKPDDEDLVLRALLRSREIKQELRDLEGQEGTLQRAVALETEFFAIRRFLEDCPTFDASLLDGTSLAQHDIR